MPFYARQPRPFKQLVVDVKAAARGEAAAIGSNSEASTIVAAVIIVGSTPQLVAVREAFARSVYPCLQQLPNLWLGPW